MLQGFVLSGLADKPKTVVSPLKETVTICILIAVSTPSVRIFISVVFAVTENSRSVSLQALGQWSTHYDLKWYQIVKSRTVYSMRQRPHAVFFGDKVRLVFV